LPRIVPLLLAVYILALPACGAGPSWETLEDGLELGVFGRITVVRVDPAGFEPELLCASRSDEPRSRPVSEWADDNGLVVATNAGMYHRDMIRHVGYLVDGDHVNNPVQVARYKSVLAMNPKRAGLPSYQLADLEQTTLEKLGEDYHTLVQNLRMISHRRTNVWAPSEEQWSTAALGVDGKGNLLFIFCRAQLSVNRLNDRLLELPIDLARAQYLEGGPEACLYIHAGQRRILLTGAVESGLGHDGGDGVSWPIPNVIGVVRRSADSPVSDRKQ
jgi:hypothetical protein